MLHSKYGSSLKQSELKESMSFDGNGYACAFRGGSSVSFILASLLDGVYSKAKEFAPSGANYFT